MEIKIGDWVRSYSQGIWRVERIIKDFYETRYSLVEPKIKSNRISIVSKRLLNDKWKRSFSIETCSIGFIQPLTIGEQNLLTDFMKENEKIIKEFEKYKKDIDLILNLGFSLDEDMKLKFESYVNELFFNKTESGLTSDEIIEIIDKSELCRCRNKKPQDRTIQFVSLNQEIINSEFIYRKYNILNF